MSFRDDSRRYGHVPPAQYPVPGQPQDHTDHVPRRPSFSNGDESSFFDASPSNTQQGYPSGAGRGNEELFLSTPTESQSPMSMRQGYSAPSPAMAGYQHQFQGQAPPSTTQPTYNPQHFARTQSASLPYHPHPVSGYSNPASPTYGSAPAPPAPAPPHQPASAPAVASPNPASYSPHQTYNPAAYANTNVPQRNATVSGFTNYGYGYNSPAGYSSPAVPQVPTFGQQPPARAYSTSQVSHAPPPPAQPGYDPSIPSSQYPPSSAGASAPSPRYDQSYSPAYSGQYFGSHSPNGVNPAPTSSYSNATPPQPPYPAYTQIPVGPNYSVADPNSFMSRSSRSNSVESPSPSGHSQSSPGLQRHPTNAPLPSRPMEDVPEEPDWVTNGQPGGDDVAQEYYTQDSLIQDIVSDLGVSPNSQHPRPANGVVTDGDMEILRRYDSAASTINTAADGSGGSGVTRFSSNASTAARNDQRASYDWDDDESDPEAVAGLLAMQEAAMDEQRFSSLPTFPYVERAQAPPLPPPPEEQESTDSDFGGGMDLGLYGGGYAGTLHYGNELGSPPATASTHDGSRPLPTLQGRGSESYPAFSAVSMDYGGTGGLLAPQRHRLSFDEGDEQVSVHSRLSGSESPLKEDYPDMFYHPGLSNRPLPAIPPGSDSSSLLSVQTSNRPPYQHGYSLSADSRHLYPAEAPEAYLGQNMNQQQFERSISLSSHSHTPQIQTPARSRTDAAEERRKATRHMTQQQQQQLAAQQGVAYEGYDTGTPPSLAAYDMITLPTGRKRKFSPSKLTPADIKRCAEPWALSAVTAWVREMAEGDPEVKRKTIEEGLVKLFCAKVPTMNVADAEVLSSMVVDSMFAAGILLPEEEWVKFGPGSMSGVLWQLTGSGCYAPKLHENESQASRLHDKSIPVRCYSHHCGRTLKKANLDHMMSEEEDKAVDWAEFYGVTPAEMERRGKKEVERQNILHEIITGEEGYMNQLDVLRLLYKDHLRACQPPIIAANRLDKFIDAVFGKVEAVQQINKEHLLAQLKYRQKEQGPWILGVSDLFREWIRKARPVYIAYSSAFPNASFLIRKEADRNLLFRHFLGVVRDHKRSKRLEWTTFVKAPITRLQRYGLLLETLKKTMKVDSEEKTNLTRALDEIKAVTHECDEKVDEMTKKVALLELQTMLVIRPGFHSVLNLDHLGRELIKQGDLQRQGSKGVRWVDTHALLFDHYFILSKAVVLKDDRGAKKYDVSKEVNASIIK